MTSEMIKAYEDAGFSRWTKGGMDRLYISSTKLGLSFSCYNSGNISNAKFNGEKISNSRAYEIRDAKIWVDVATGELTVRGDDPLLIESANALVASIENEQSAQDESPNIDASGRDDARSAKSSDEIAQHASPDGQKGNTMINWRVYTDGDGRIYFEDDNDKIELTEYVAAESITYDEREGYILPDGRNLSEISK